MSEETVKIPVIKYEQGGIPMYVGKMRAEDILHTWKIDEFTEDHLDAYQRQRYPERTEEIANYLSNCSIPMIPPLLASLRKGVKFTPTNEDLGFLEIPKYGGAIFMVDGGHRTGGFEAIKKRIKEMKVGRRKLSEEEVSALRNLMNFEVPIAFFDAEAAVKKVNEVVSPERRENMLKELGEEELSSDDVERIFFFVINKTQKSIRPSLKDTLMYLIAASGIKGIPIIEKEKWRTEATPIGMDLNFEKDSPLHGLVSISGARGLGRPIQLASFVTSLKHLMRNDRFRKLAHRERFAFLKAYWSIIKSMVPDAFREDLRGNYLILKAIGVYSLDWLANDVFNWCVDEGIERPSEDDIRRFLEPLKGFNWTTDSSPIGPYGGLKGVKEAHKLLLAVLAHQGIDKALETLKEPSMKLTEGEIGTLLAMAATSIKRAKT